MSWADDEGLDGYEDDLDYDSDWDDEAVAACNSPQRWVTKDRSVITITALTDSHLGNIIRCINNGAPCYGQHWKLAGLVAEQKRRMNKPTETT